MVYRKFLLGVSVFALTAAPALAQTTNRSELTQNGLDNVIEFGNAFEGNDFNIIRIDQNGDRSRATSFQYGDLHESDIEQIGDEHVAVHTQSGESHTSATFQVGDRDRSAIRQAGEENRAGVDQDGDRNLSQVAQGIDASATGDYTNSGFFDPAAGAARAGDDNRATVSQVGDDLSSTIRQRSRANGPAADDNVVRLRQRGRFNSATIVQESRGNTADVFQFQGGTTAAAGNSISITQGNTGATSASNPLSNNWADVAVSGQSNSTTLVQNGRLNEAEVTQGLGIASRIQISQVGDVGSNEALVAQYGDSNAVAIGQNSAGARAVVWQQSGPSGGRSSNNAVDIQQGTGATGTEAFSAGFFGNTAPTGAQTSNLVADVTQGNNPGRADWNLAQVRQDGTGLTATATQAGSASSALPNIVRIAQQGQNNSAAAVQTAGVGPSSAADSAPTGQPQDEFYFAGGARSAEIAILQSGSGNSATIEQRGLGQYARIEQGPGGGNVASILQDTGATNATAIIRQTGSNNSYSVSQAEANQYILVSQTGSNNEVTDVVRRPDD